MLNWLCGNQFITAQVYSHENYSWVIWKTSIFFLHHLWHWHSIVLFNSAGEWQLIFIKLLSILLLQNSRICEIIRRFKVFAEKIIICFEESLHLVRVIEGHFYKFNLPYLFMLCDCGQPVCVTEHKFKIISICTQNTRSNMSFVVCRGQFYKLYFNVFHCVFRFRTVSHGFTDIILYNIHPIIYTLGRIAVSQIQFDYS